MLLSIRTSLRRTISQSYYHTTPVKAGLKRTAVVFSKDSLSSTPPPPPLTGPETEKETETENTKDNQEDKAIVEASNIPIEINGITLPSNLNITDPYIFETPTALDLSGANRGQPEVSNVAKNAKETNDANATEKDSQPSFPPSLDLPIQSFQSENGNTTGDIVSLNPDVFAQPVRRDIVQRVIKWQLAKRRQGTHKQKNISEVSGSGRKPWQQKGTGRARAGHRRPPHWRGGARAFAKVPRDYTYKLQKRVRNMGLRSALSAKVLENAIHIVDVSTMTTHKTAALVSWLAEKDVDSALFVDGEQVNETLELAIGNIPRVALLPQLGANVYDIVKQRDLILTKEGLESLTRRVLATGRPKEKRRAYYNDDETAATNMVDASGAVEEEEEEKKHITTPGAV